MYRVRIRSTNPATVRSGLPQVVADGGGVDPQFPVGPFEFLASLPDRGVCGGEFPFGAKPRGDVGDDERAPAVELGHRDLEGTGHPQRGVAGQGGGEGHPGVDDRAVVVEQLRGRGQRPGHVVAVTDEVGLGALDHRARWSAGPRPTTS